MHISTVFRTMRLSRFRRICVENNSRYCDSCDCVLYGSVFPDKDRDAFSESDHSNPFDSDVLLRRHDSCIPEHEETGTFEQFLGVCTADRVFDLQYDYYSKLFLFHRQRDGGGSLD